jgi:histidine triad (HIT) family protein
MKTFEDIVSGNTPCHKVWEDEHHIAFLNMRPVRPGHVIVIPKRVSSYVFDMPAEEYHALWEAARIVAREMRERLGCERVCTAVVGWEVRHTHIHLVPTDRASEFPSLPGKEASAEELGKMASRLRPRDAESAAAASPRASARS